MHGQMNVRNGKLTLLNCNTTKSFSASQKQYVLQEESAMEASSSIIQSEMYLRHPRYYEVVYTTNKRRILGYFRYDTLF